MCENGYFVYCYGEERVNGVIFMSFEPVDETIDLKRTGSA
jgi:hypothetical protein